MATIKDLWLPGQICSQSRVAIPNDFARSAMFSSLALRAKRKVFLAPATKDYPKTNLLAATSGYEIYQRQGRQLTQAEGSLWFELVRLALNADSAALTEKGQVLVAFTGNEMLRLLGKPLTGQAHKELRIALNCLGDARIEVRYGGNNWIANLLSIGACPTGRDTHYTVHLDANLAKLLMTGYTLQNLEERRRLKGNPLAQWLHAFYSTHEKPMDYKESTLKLLAGRPDQRPAAWLEALQIALVLLEKVTKWSCKIVGDKVEIDRNLGEKTKKRDAKKQQLADAAALKKVEQKPSEDDDEYDI